MDEAQALAQETLRAVATENLTEEELTELREQGMLTARAGPGEGWDAVVGFIPEQHLYYEIEIYRPSDKCPYIDKSFVRMLVPRDRSTETIYFIWRPNVPPYNGPYFE